MQALLGNIEVTIWSNISVLLYSLMFVALVVWVFHPARRTTYNQAAQLPLDQE